MKTIHRPHLLACALRFSANLHPARLRLLGLASALALGALAQAASARAQEALDFTSLGSGFDYTQGTYSLGWAFTTNQAVTVTALGFYDDLKNGITGQHPVGIYDADTRQLIVSAPVSPSDPLTGFFRYTPVPATTLPAGHNYFIVAVTFQDHYAVAPTDLIIDPSITFMGFASYGGSGGPEATELKCPTNYTTNNFHGDFGPSFKLQSAPVIPGGDPSALTFKGVASTITANVDLGWEFTPKKDIKIASVGYYQDNPAGFTQSHPVAVWDAITASVVVPEILVTNNDPLDGFFRYHATAPVTLLANHPYFIMGVSGSDPYATQVKQLNVNPLISYQGAVYNGDTTQTVPAFPDHVDGGPGFFGPSFQTAATTGEYITATVDNPNISRAASQIATITVTRTGTTDLTQDVAVSYQIEGTLQPGVDYEALKGTRKIKAGNQSAKVRIKPIAGGANGVVKFTVEPTTDYDPSTPATLKIKITP